MEEKMVNQFGKSPIYIERNKGNIYVGDNYVEDASFAFSRGSYDLLGYTPSIRPAIHREEVALIQKWIEKEEEEKSSRLALLYGKAGIGKSIVMHNLLEKLQLRDDYLVLGLKSDQIEFVDTDELSQKMHLARSIEVVVQEMAQKYKRVVLLIDQIDALSLSLSSNRTPLRSLLNLIKKIQYISNVRVVISCRPYDLEYDPLLNNLRIKNRWELQEFSKEQVLRTLKDNQCNERLDDNLLRFLGNPLHLHLFLKVKPHEQLTNPLSTDLLYHQLWSKYVNDNSVRRVDKNRLLSLLDALVETMYQRQELSVHIRDFETEYTSELQYLSTNEFLITTGGRYVQFFHQTLFDYVYARRFLESGGDLLSVLKGQHQGLFSRASVKSVLTFLREQKPSDYIHTLYQLLYAKNENGRDTYRFHLKSLALSTLAYFEYPLPGELNLISEKLYSDQIYMDVIFESVYTESWFKAIWKIIDSKGGWKKLSKEYQEKTIVMCQRVLWQDAGIVLDKLDKVLDYDDIEDRKYLESLLYSHHLNCGGDKLIALYNKLVKRKNPLEYTHLLSNILRENPTFVCEELKENVRLQLEENRDIDRLVLPTDVEFLYHELLEKHHDISIQLLVDILTIFYEATQYELMGGEICHSSSFFNFQRNTGGHFTHHNFIESVMNILFDDFLNDIEEEKVKNYITEFSKSKYEGLVYMALYVYTSHPEVFKDDIYEIITNRQVLENAPSWVEYQAVEALRVSFPLMTDEQKMSIVDRILTIDDKGEYQFFKGRVEWSRKYGHPLLDIDLHKGIALSAIPIVELRRISWEAYQESQRIKRKFHPERLKNSEPPKISCHIGYPSLNKEQGQKMSPKAWRKSMLKYTNDPISWETPSLSGQCQLFRDVVSKEPDKFTELINQIISEEGIQLAYPLAGLKGLIDAGRMSDAMQVLGEIIDVINNDLNSTERGFSVYSLLSVLQDFIEKNNVSKTVIQLLCRMLIHLKEGEENGAREGQDIYGIGINQARGRTGYLLVKCACEGLYKEEIFSAIESIAETASVYTRAAILGDMAMLNFLDQDRNVRLFKRLMHDYNPRLMSMPIHNYNPLVYFVNYAVEELIEFFHHATEHPQCYPQQSIILWLAWSHNNHDERFKTLLDKMFDTSEEARIALVDFFGSLGNKVDEDAISYILYSMDSRFDTPKLGSALDNLFYYIDKWSENEQYRVVDAYVHSPSCRHRIKKFARFLGSYAIKDPVQTLKWLEQVVDIDILEDDSTWSDIVDVLIQSYNGIKSFNDNSYQETLEYAMDLIDTIMQNPNNKSLISSFIHKLDNE